MDAFVGCLCGKCPEQADVGKLDPFVSALRVMSPPVRISTCAAVLARYQSNTSEFAPRLLVAAISTRSADEVRTVVNIARRTGTPLHPISTGRNWGLGSMLAVHGPAAVIDLRAMDQICAIDQAEAVAVIEPGVTQGKLADELERLGGRLKFNVTGAGRETSIVGNVLDRGGGHLGPRVDDLLAVEAVLGNGQVVRTGQWHFTAAMDGRQHYYRHGLGPDLTGLFVQSGLGIVTRIAMRLYRRQPFTDLSLSTREDRISGLVDALRSACDDGLIAGYVRINDGADPHIRYFRPIPPDAWNVHVRVTGVDAVRSTVVAVLRRRLGPSARQFDVLDSNGSGSARGDMGGNEVLARLEAGDGVPTDRSLASLAQAVGRQFSSATFDLDGDRELPGFLCVNVVLPFSGTALVRCARIVADEAERSGLSIARHFGMIGPGALSGFFAFYFDRKDAVQVRRAHAVKDALVERLESDGIYPMRIDIDSAGAFLRRNDDTFWQTVAALRGSLDPDQIIVSRYNPVSH